jgi:hypothetical protein
LLGNFPRWLRQLQTAELLFWPVNAATAPGAVEGLNHIVHGQERFQR